MKGGRKIQTAINGAREELDLRVTVRRADEIGEVPMWERAEQRLSLVPIGKARPWDEVLIERITGEQPVVTTLKAVSQRYAASVGRAVETVRPRLSKPIEHNGKRWFARPVASFRCVPSLCHVLHVEVSDPAAEMTAEAQRRELEQIAAELSDALTVAADALSR
ncbi:hypothetical protein J7I98_31390 [Streptomyces sp. ISL-98]|uniref:hypothetical protein n=1 Tax=Streptomyces sp. ISL-98 TaxID=2819192 RepID=UPI001BE52C9E|nr:hypothetical protein [Streptomyces sp. ISL-98]MBT2510281.1 hypothetical protein [Streptomyces sp. ISL-98]